MTRAHFSLLTFVLLAAAAVGFLGVRMSVVSDMSAFLPQHADARERLLIEELRSGVAGRLLFAAITGGTLAARVEANRALADRLRADPQFEWVSNGADAVSEDAQRRLFAARYLLSPDVSAARFSTAALRASLLERLQQLATSFGVVSKQWLAADPTGEFLNAMRAWQPPPQVHRVDGVLASADESRTLLVARTRARGDDLDAQALALARVHALFAEVGAGHALSLRMAGAPVHALSARARVKADAMRLSTLAIGFVLVFLYAVFHSLRAVALSAVPLAFGVLAGMTASVAGFGSVHGITIAFGSTLIGVAVDYPLHYLGHLTRAAASPYRQLATIWPTLRLGAVTTMIAFAALLFSGHRGLAQLGVFAVAGIATAAATTRWLLPALIPQGYSLRLPRGPAHRAFARAARWLPRWRWLLLLPPLAALTTLGFLRAQIWESDIAQLSPIGAADKAFDAQVRADLAAPGAGQMLVLTAATAEAALAASERLMPILTQLVARGELGAFDMAARYLPSVATQRQRQRQLPAADVVQRNLHAALRGLPFRGDTFAPFLADYARARTQRPLTPADLADTPLAARLAPLLFAREGEWNATVLLREVKHPQAMAEMARSQAGALYLDTKQASARLMTQYRDRALGLLAWGTLGILLSLWIGLRSWTRAAWVLLSPLAAIVTVCAGLVLAGAALSLFHVVALLLVLGLGIDYALYFDRLDRHANEWDTTFPALWKAWLTTALGFATLALSPVPVLRALGVTVAFGVSLAFVFGAAWARRARR